MNSPVVNIDGHEMVPTNDEDALMKAVANQPVSVAIDASGSDLQFYSEVKKKLTSQLKHRLLTKPIRMRLPHSHVNRGRTKF